MSAFPLSKTKVKLPQVIIAAVILSSAAIVVILNSYSYPIPFLKSPQKINADLIGQLGQFPVKQENSEQPPQLNARSATVIDNVTGITLYEKNPDIKHLPASTTKLMTALIALENCLPQSAIRAGYIEKEGAVMGLQEGDTLTLENLLYGLLVPSGNDAAYVLAYSCARSYDDFIEAMNKKSKELGMLSTHFENPAGFDSESQFSTARDLTKLARVAVANPIISKIVTVKSVVINDVTGTKTYYLENVNKLLGAIPGVEGVKTGQTEGSLENLVVKITRDNHTLIAVVLGSQDRFGESTALIEWAYKNFTWQTP